MIPKIALIILNWKQPQLTIDTIESILKTKTKGFLYHIYIVDNGSPDDSVHQFNSKYKKNKNITVVETGDNLGYAGGNNYGLREALKQNFDYYLVANNDILVAPDFLQKLYDDSLRYPNAILTPKIYFAPGFEFHKDRYQKKEIGKVIWAVGSQIDWDNIYGSNIGIDEVDHGQYDKKQPKIDFISGCCFLISKEVIKKVGIFDEKYYLYMEDSDLTQRALKAGYELRLVPKSIIWHCNSGSSKPGSSLQDYFITRNRLLFGFKYASLRTKFALFRESIRFLFTGSSWRKKGVIDFYTGRFGKGSWQ
ncbi:MAG TPA: glycosyltransferase family 2 protein [Candidatus Methanoperedens sp.]|nr:glycosyltransferase family 2 protein [Candidatus Methanoperedens sp.]